MIKVQVKPEDIFVLSKERYEYPHPRVQQRMEVILLKSKGFSNSLICSALNICPNTLRSVYRIYNEGGIEKLKEVNFYRPQSELKEFSATIEDYFEKNPPRSINEAAAKIKELTGVERKETQVRKFLKDMNFRFIKVGSVPAKALTEEKKRNKENFWKKNSNQD
jgi:transposase